MHIIASLGVSQIDHCLFTRVALASINRMMSDNDSLKIKPNLIKSDLARSYDVIIDLFFISFLQGMID